MKFRENQVTLNPFSLNLTFQIELIITMLIPDCYLKSDSWGDFI